MSTRKSFTLLERPYTYNVEYYWLSSYLVLIWLQSVGINVSGLCVAILTIQTFQDYAMLEELLPDGIMKYSLVIRASKSQHYGLYNCTVTNEYGNANVAIVLKPLSEFYLLVNMQLSEFYLLVCNFVFGTYLKSFIPFLSEWSPFLSSTWVGKRNIDSKSLSVIWILFLRCTLLRHGNGTAFIFWDLKVFP